MMCLLFKSRLEPPELAILESLNNRMQLSKAHQQIFSSLRKGYKGEQLFDEWMEMLNCDCLVLNDLLLKTNNQTFQIDTLLILNDHIYIFEIKNYVGDYYFETNRFFQKNKPETEISNPLIQLSRTESLLRQLLHKFNNSTPIHSFVIFINPEFTLYQAPLDIPFIFPTQLKRFIEKLNYVQSSLQVKHHNLAEKLVSLNNIEYPYQKFTSYNYQNLRKGMTCAGCHSFSISIQQNKTICTDCEFVEKLEVTVLRSIEEFKRLFPNEKITTNNMHEWCKIIDSKKTIQRILSKNYSKVGVRQWLYYK